MNRGAARVTNTNCPDCPFRDNPHFRDFQSEQLRFITRFKAGEMAIDSGTTVIVEGSHSGHLFTILEGLAYRYKLLDDGRRQILNFAMPGDLIGLQGMLMGEMQHSIEALTPLRLCLFERERIKELYISHPELAYDITWMAAREERILDEHILSIGRRSALERAAYLVAFLHRRGVRSGFLNRKPHILPVTQQHMADTLGLSLVHTNKTLKRLSARHLIAWRDRGCEVKDPDALSEIAGWPQEDEHLRPFL